MKKVRGKHMDEQINVIYLYNSGVLISFKDEAVLVDGVFSDNNSFDKMPNDYKKDLLNRKGLFENLKCMLFTHCHNDHYEHDVVELLREKYSDIIVLSPEKANGVTMHSPSGQFNIGKIKIHFIETGHIGPGFGDCRHYAYKVCVNDKSIIITGDMDHKKLETVLYTYGTGADAFFINPALLMYEMKNCEKTLLKSIQNIFVYHIPSEDNDMLGYRMMTNNMTNRVKSCLGRVKILNDNMKKLYI